MATKPLLVEDYGGYIWLYTTKYIADYHHNRESLSTHHYGMTEGFEHGSHEDKHNMHVYNLHVYNCTYYAYTYTCMHAMFVCV